MSFDFKPTASDNPTLYRDLLSAIDAVTAGERDAIANMANAASLLFDWLPDVNWAGFYRLIEGELVLGPVQGKSACIRIELGKGVCGTAAQTRETQLVEDVHAFPGHIACDAASASEIVVPLIVNGQLLGVLDIDSPVVARFDEDDRAGCEAIARLLETRLI
jgi:L-methionine (R)-S-oxide reductase